MAKKTNGGFKLFLEVIIILGLAMIPVIFTYGKQSNKIENMATVLETKSDRAVCDTRYTHMEEHMQDAKAERKQILELIREIRGDR